MAHLALAVRDEERTRSFYERYFGFDAEPAQRMDDGVLMLHDGHGFALALKQTDEPISLPAFVHFGFRGAESPDEVRSLGTRLERDGVPIAEWWTSPPTSASSAVTPTATSSSTPGRRTRPLLLLARTSDLS